MELPAKPDTTRIILERVKGFAATFVFMYPDGSGYLWGEPTANGEFFVHQFYVRPGQPSEPLWRAAVHAAAELGCTALLGITYRLERFTAMRRRFKAYPIGLLFRTELEEHI